MKLVKDNSIGLGLSNSKLFIDALNGKIKFLKSEPGETQLLVSIPVKLSNTFIRCTNSVNRQIE